MLPSDTERLPGFRSWRLLAVLTCIFAFAAPFSSAFQIDVDHIQQSVRLISAADLSGAEKEARLALRDPSTRPAAWTALGVISIRQKRYVQAAQFLKAALRLDPGLAGAHIALSEVYAQTGKKEEAGKLLREVLRKEPGNPEVLLALAQLETANGNFSASLSLGEPILAEFRRSAAGIVLLAKDYAGLKRKEPLAALVPDWNALPDVSATDTTDFVSILEKFGLDQQALEVLEKAKAGGRVSVDLALALGNLYFTKGDFDQAFESYEAALSLNPDCVNCLQQLASIAERERDPEKALAYLIKAKRRLPDDPEILFEYGKACLELDLFEDAVPALRKAVRLRPNQDSYAYVLGSAYVSKKQYELAGTVFEALLKKHPGDSVLNYAMGSLLFLQVKFDEAARYLSKSIQLQPDQSAAYYYVGLIAEGKGKDNEAITIFRDVLRRDPDYGPAYEALGRVLLKEKQYPEAEQTLRKAVLLNPDSVKAHYQLGTLLGRTGRQEEASTELAVVRKLNATEEQKTGLRLRILSAH